MITKLTFHALVFFLFVNNLFAAHNESYVKRPLNCFFLWAKVARPKLLSQYPQTPNNIISKMLGEKWKSLPKEIKKEWREKQNLEKAKHQLENPGYDYAEVLKKSKSQTETSSMKKHRKVPLKNKQEKSKQARLRQKEGTKISLDPQSRTQHKKKPLRRLSAIAVEEYFKNIEGQ